MEVEPVPTMRLAFNLNQPRNYRTESGVGLLPFPDTIQALRKRPDASLVVHGWVVLPDALTRPTQRDILPLWCLEQS